MVCGILVDDAYMAEVEKFKQDLEVELAKRQIAHKRELFTAKKKLLQLTRLRSKVASLKPEIVAVILRTNSGNDDYGQILQYIDEFYELAEEVSK